MPARAAMSVEGPMRHAVRRPHAGSFDMSGDAGQEATGGDQAKAQPGGSGSGAFGFGETTDAALHMVNMVVGGSVLALPKIFASCGLLLGTAGLALCAACTLISLRLLVHCAERTGASRYEQAMGIAFGAAGRRVAEAFLILLQLGCLVGSLNILADVVSPLANSVVPPGAEPSRGIIMAGVVAVGLLPLSISAPSSAAKDTAHMSLLGVGFVVAFTLAIAAHLWLPAAAAGPSLSPSPGLVLFRAGGLLNSLPVLCFAFTAHAWVFPAYEALPSPRRMDAALQRAVAACFVIYLTAGALGYAAFKERTSGNVLRNFEGPRLGAAASRAIKLTYGVAVIGAVPSSLVPVRDMLAGLILPRATAAAGGGGGGALPTRLLTAVVLCATLALASLLPNVEYAFGITGATASMVLSYVLPASLYLRVFSDDAGAGNAGSTKGPPSRGRDWDRRAAWALLIAGLAAAVVCTTSTVMAVKTEQSLVHLSRALATLESRAAAAAAREGTVLAAMRDVAAADSAVAATAAELESAAEGLRRAQSEEAGAVDALSLQAGRVLRKRNRGTALPLLEDARNTTAAAVAQLGRAATVLHHNGTGGRPGAASPAPGGSAGGESGDAEESGESEAEARRESELRDAKAIVGDAAESAAAAKAAIHSVAVVLSGPGANRTSKRAAATAAAAVAESAADHTAAAVERASVDLGLAEQASRGRTDARERASRVLGPGQPGRNGSVALRQKGNATLAALGSERARASRAKATLEGTAADGEQLSRAKEIAASLVAPGDSDQAAAADKRAAGG